MSLKGRAVLGADAFVSELKRAGVSVQPGLNELTRTYGQLLQTRVQAKASGRPGPNAPTGDYRRSWNVQMRVVDGAAVADVGTNKPQGRRLEFGFTGEDSLGRVYDQPPYPHVWPAAAEVFPQYERACNALLARLL
jgi:hypothetical protein